MKAAVITCNNADNHGARLQVYALSRYLSDRGHEVEVIDYMPPYCRFDLKQWFWPGLDVKSWGRLLLQGRQRRIDINKHARMQDFSSRFTRLTEQCYQSLDQLRLSPPEADVYIAGSDQIWNTTLPNGKDPAYYLDFGSDASRRVSYAASFATPSLDAVWRSQVSGWLKRLDAISVREPSGAAIVDDLGYKATVVCDPVWLLSPSHWSAEVSDHTGRGECYLLVYDFMRCQKLKALARRIARQRGLKIYSVGPWPVDYAHQNFCDCSPQRFVALIENAACVVSNSLHGTLFSMLFERDFFLINRDDGLNQRMADLLHGFGLDGRIIDLHTSDSALSIPVDYTDITEKRNKLVQSSKAWLQFQGL